MKGPPNGHANPHRFSNQPPHPSTSPPKDRPFIPPTHINPSAPPNPQPPYTDYQMAPSPTSPPNGYYYPPQPPPQQFFQPGGQMPHWMYGQQQPQQQQQQQQSPPFDPQMTNGQQPQWFGLHPMYQTQQPPPPPPQFSNAPPLHQHYPAQYPTPQYIGNPYMQQQQGAPPPHHHPQMNPQQFQLPPPAPYHHHQQQHQQQQGPYPHQQNQYRPPQGAPPQQQQQQQQPGPPIYAQARAAGIPPPRQQQQQQQQPQRLNASRPSFVPRNPPISAVPVLPFEVAAPPSAPAPAPSPAPVPAPPSAPASAAATSPRPPALEPPIADELTAPTPTPADAAPSEDPAPAPAPATFPPSSSSSSVTPAPTPGPRVRRIWGADLEVTVVTAVGSVEVGEAIGETAVGAGGGVEVGGGELGGDGDVPTRLTSLEDGITELVFTLPSALSRPPSPSRPEIEVHVGRGTRAGGQVGGVNVKAFKQNELGLGRNKKLRIHRAVRPQRSTTPKPVVRVPASVPAIDMSTRSITPKPRSIATPAPTPTPTIRAPLPALKPNTTPTPTLTPTAHAPRPPRPADTRSPSPNSASTENSLIAPELESSRATTPGTGGSSPKAKGVATTSISGETVRATRPSGSGRGAIISVELKSPPPQVVSPTRSIPPTYPLARTATGTSASPTDGGASVTLVETRKEAPLPPPLTMSYADRMKQRVGPPAPPTAPAPAPAPTAAQNAEPSSSRPSSTTPHPPPPPPTQRTPVVLERRGAGLSMEQLLTEGLTRVSGAPKVPLLTPRGMTNMGNFCPINSALQAFLYTRVLYEFVMEVGQRDPEFGGGVAPLLEALFYLFVEFTRTTKEDFPASLQSRNLAFPLPGNRAKKAEVKEKEKEAAPEPIIPWGVYRALKRIHAAKEEAERRKPGKENAKVEQFAYMVEYDTLGVEQQDVEEFVVQFLDQLAEDCRRLREVHGGASGALEQGSAEQAWTEVSRKGKGTVPRTTKDMEGPSAVRAIFEGKARMSTLTNGKASANTEPFKTLQISVQSHEIRDIITAMRHGAQMQEVQGVKEKGSGPLVKRNQTLEAPPEVLLIQLVRFGYSNETATKLGKHVGYTSILDIPESFITPTSRQRRADGRLIPWRYRLFAVIYHHGTTVHSGHYSTDVLRQDGEGWLRINNELVTAVSESDVMSKSMTEAHKTAYLLFYEKMAV